jgi:pimeloyl-ACP methyl ester carboxylesterase
MQVVDRGTGSPLVLVPGLQGRWEYMRPAVNALASRFRVLTFSLCGEPPSGVPFEPDRGMDAYADQIAALLDECGIARAVICGVSFGGLVALRFAARHPDRTAALVMVSTPGPQWHLKPKHEMYSKLPWLFGPVFFAESPARLRKEIEIAVPDRAARRRLLRLQLKTLVTAPLSPARLAARARLIGAYDRVKDALSISRPTLILHGDPELDHVVSASGSSEYGQLIPGARVEVLEETGHLGTITRPEAFVGAVRRFMDSLRPDAHDSAA